MRYSIKQINGVVNGKLIKGDDSLHVTGVSMDSRKIKKGELFVAIIGQNRDGHKYINDVLKKGVCGIVVSKRVPLKKNIPIILVRDTTKAFGQIAGFHRQQFDIPVVAITGSVGKTTTKDMAASILESKFNVLKNFKTENNQYGVPLTLLRLKKSHDIVVLEFGSNRPGDIAWLESITRPTVAVFTAIGESHLELLKTRSGVFHEKMQLIKNMGKDNYVIFNADDEYLKKIKSKKIEPKKIPYSIRAHSATQAKDIEVKKDGCIDFRVNNKKYTICCLARHNIYNALAAICCGILFKIKINNININLKKTQFCKGRQGLINLKKVTVIDDTYNSNPLSFASAIETLRDFKVKGKRICVCGDMLELGSSSKALHEKMGRLILKSNIDHVFSYGPYSKHIVNIVRRSKKDIKAEHFERFEELNPALKDTVKDNDVVLVKGSRGMKMETAVDFLKMNF